MAGIPGMATPASIGTTQQNTPQAVPMPPTQPAAQVTQGQPPPVADAAAQQPSDGIDYDALAKDALAGKYNNAKGEIDYDKMAKEALAPKQGFMSRLGGDIGSVVKGVGDVLAPAMEPIKQGIQSVANTEHPLTLAIPGVAAQKFGQGFSKGMEAPSMGDVFNTKLPSSIAKGVTLTIPASTMNTMSPELQDMAMEQLMPKEGQKPYETQITPGGALDLAVGIAAPDAVVAGIEKAPLIANLIGKGLAPIAKMANKIKPQAFADAAKVTEATDSIVSDLSTLAKIDQHIPLTRNAINITDPKLQDIAKNVADNKTLQDVWDATGAKIVNATLDSVKATANLGEGVASTDSIYKTMQDAVNVEGKLYGNYKGEALKIAKNKPVDAAAFKTELTSVMDKLTGNATDGYILGKSELESVTKEVSDLNEAFFNKPNMTLKELDTHYNRIGNLAKQAFKKAKMGTGSYDTASIYGNLRGEMNQSLRDIVGETLKDANPNAYKEFSAVNNSYSEVKGATKTLGRSLDKNNIAADVLVKKMYFSPESSPDIANAANVVLGKHNPSMINDLRGYGVKTLLDYGNEAISAENKLGFNFAKVLEKAQDMRGISAESTNLFDSMIGSKKAADDMLASLKVGARWQQAHTAATPVASESFIRNLLHYGAKADLAHPGTYVEAMISAVKRNGNISKVLEGVDTKAILSEFPPEARAKQADNLKKLLGR